ncbi:MAG: hypothetical protein ACYDG6_06875 [Thermincolia bacterium]
MSNITTYPEMNAKIVAILQVSDNPTNLYAAQRIEELESEIIRLKALIQEALPDELYQQMRQAIGFDDVAVDVPRRKGVTNESKND